MRGHKGRSIDLLHKRQAYQLQDAGADTVDANLALGTPADARGTGAQVLADLGVHSIGLPPNNPAKRAAWEGYGLRVVERVPVPVRPNPENLRYLHTRRDQMGHDLPGLAKTGIPVPTETDHRAANAGSDDRREAAPRPRAAHTVAG